MTTIKSSDYTYYADIGCVRLVTSDGSAIMIPNGYGDGSFEIHIIDKTTWITGNYRFCGYIEGKFSICEYDTSNDSIIAQLYGKYSVYNRHGDIIFKKWS